MHRFRLQISAILLVSVLGACTKGLYGDGTSSVLGTVTDGLEVASAGVLTAGEWNDLSNWDFWGDLLSNSQFEGYQNYWSMFTDNRVAVSVQLPGGEPAIGVKVCLTRDGAQIWQAVTDNLGEAECWYSYFGHDASVVYDSTSWSAFGISLDGIAQEESPLFSKRGYPASINTYTVASCAAPAASADVAFIVDATGSMDDEIEFLKQDLMSILRRVKDSTDVVLRTASVFYRDQTDSYLTKYSAFTDDITSTVNFISSQRAAGGGDYEEAVHSALESSLKDLKWNAGGRARIAFLIFDAPAHQENKNVIASLQASTEAYAALGIKLIPVLASGGSKEAEFLGRLMAIATNGTYVFLTDASGIGADHIEASVGEYRLEKLNDLLVRVLLDNIL